MYYQYNQPILYYKFNQNYQKNGLYSPQLVMGRKPILPFKSLRYTYIFHPVFN